MTEFNTLTVKIKPKDPKNRSPLVLSYRVTPTSHKPHSPHSSTLMTCIDLRNVEIDDAKGCFLCLSGSVFQKKDFFFHYIRRQAL